MTLVCCGTAYPSPAECADLSDPGPPLRNFDWGARRFPRGDSLSQTEVIFIFSRKIRKYLLCELNYNASNSQEIASLSLNYSSGGVKTTFSTVMRTLLGPRSATILIPLRGLAASLRGLQPPQLTC